MNNLMETFYPFERRSNTERRNLQAQLSGLVNLGHRRQLRRLDDRRKAILLDHYPSILLVLGVAILLMNLGDAVLTLILIEHGAVELNPFMNYLLKTGPFIFLVVKYGLTAASVIIFLIFNHYQLPVIKISARTYLNVILIIFSAVIVWQIYLLKEFVL